MSGVEALYPVLAELALHSTDQRAFREQWLTCVSRFFSVDMASASSTRDGHTFASRTVNADLPPLDFQRYLTQIERPELARLIEGRMVWDDYVFSDGRRARLSVYRDFLEPHSVVRNAMRVWIRGGSFFFVCFSQRRGTKSLAADDLKSLDVLFPVIALGEALHAGHGAAPSKQASSVLDSLTERERTVVALAQRGLTNVDISRLTGSTRAVVRNQLSSAYGKLGVKNRTELTFLLSGAESDVRTIRKMPTGEIEKLLVEHEPSRRGYYA